MSEAGISSSMVDHKKNKCNSGTGLTKKIPKNQIAKGKR
jgi:hypothetical protein